ncbi:MAG: nitrate reductase associated protein [Pleurocapsa sp.]
METPKINEKTVKIHNHFQFEAEFIESLRCIPMLVRMKLDTCGVKLKLSHWHQFSQLERQTLVEMPCDRPNEIQAYREWLQNLITAKTGAPAKELTIDPHPPWLDATQIPVEVQTQAQAHDVTISIAQWEQLNPAQRFALIKLSRPSHENRNFLPALKEFKIT